jgi:phytoene dehydrogenase-like protein
LLEAEVARLFPQSLDRFIAFKAAIRSLDPFASGPWRSARAFLAATLNNPLLADMLLLPLMVYGNAEEHDMDLRQFAIMFRAVFEEGFFRPSGSMRDFLDLLLGHYRGFGGEHRFFSPVARIRFSRGRAEGVLLEDGTAIGAQAILSTAGIPETIRLSGWDTDPEPYCGRMSFMETISLIPRHLIRQVDDRRTIVFYSAREEFGYERPQSFLDTDWGVICFPDNFAGHPPRDLVPLRVTHAANYALWKDLGAEEYGRVKRIWSEASVAASEAVIGTYRQHVVFHDSFSPLTIERFTRKCQGAVYGSPIKIRDGLTPWPNLFLAGTDQGYLGIVGAMLSGITIVNRHLLH